MANTSRKFAGIEIDGNWIPLPERFIMGEIQKITIDITDPPDLMAKINGEHKTLALKVAQLFADWGYRVTIETAMDADNKGTALLPGK